MQHLIAFFFLRIRRPPRSTLDRSSAASDVYKRQALVNRVAYLPILPTVGLNAVISKQMLTVNAVQQLSLIHISEPTRPY